MIVGVTGGLGYIGSKLVIELEKKGHIVLIADKQMYPVNPEFFKIINESNSIKYDKFDVLDVNKTEEWLKQCDVIVNLSALVGETICKKNIDETIDINQNFAMKLSTLCKNHKKRYIFLSTCSNYGSSDELCNEDYELNPLTIYAKTKVNVEGFIKRSNPNAVILRMSTIFGVSVSRTRLDIIPNQFVKEALKDMQIFVFNPEHSRPIIHVKDAVNIIIKFVEAKNIKHVVYNVGFDKMNLTKTRMIKEIIYQTGARMSRVSSSDNRTYEVDFSRLHEEFDIEQEMSLRDGIMEICDAIIKNSIDTNTGNY